MIVNNNLDTYYTLDNNGFLSKIEFLPNSKEWYEKIAETAQKLEIARCDGKILFLFRGESRNLFAQKTGIEHPFDEEPHYDRYFVIGSKAKSYYKDKQKGIISIKQFDHSQKAAYIFDGLSKLSKLPDLGGYLDYFSNIDNEDDFYTRLSGIKNNRHLLTMENFYLAFIHTFSSEPNIIRAHSVLLSSTKNLNTAKEFSNGGYVIGFWLKRPLDYQAIDYNTINRYYALLNKYSLPTIEHINFPDESEVTIFSAIIPHTIFYVHDLINNRTIFNPYIIRTEVDDILVDGINVDQTYFYKTIKGIYSRSIWQRDGELLFEVESDA